MDLEYLIVGIAKDQQDDFKEFYEKTKIEVYMYAMSIVRDRFLARDIAVEAYRRVNMLAYKFDTDLNAEYWLLDIVKNLSINALKDDELRKVAENIRVDNLSGLLRAAVVETAEDRGKIIVLRVASELSKSEVAKLLWYQQGSASAEYRRGLKELVKMFPDDTTSATVISDLKKDMKNCTPDMWGLVIGKDETKVSFVSHEELEISEEELEFSEENEEFQKIKRVSDSKKRKKKIYTVAAVIVLAICVISLAIFGVVSYINDSGKKDKKDDVIGEFDKNTPPQFGTKLVMAEVNDVLYFQDYSQGKVLSKAEIKDGKAVVTKLSDAEPKEIITDGSYIYYRDNNDGKIYKMSVSDDSVTKLMQQSGTCIEYYDGYIYFSSSKVGILRISVSGDESTIEDVFLKEPGNQPHVEDIEISDSGDVYFSSGSNKGLYKLKELEEYNSPFFNDEIYSGEVYSFEVHDDKIFFDISADGMVSFHSLSLSEKNDDDIFSDVYLASAAICVKDGYIYYEGYSKIDDKGNKFDRGVYRVSVDGENSEMLIPAIDESMFVSDMYISESRVYCYYRTGADDGAKKLIAYSREGLSVDTCESKQTVIFDVK